MKTMFVRWLLIAIWALPAAAQAGSAQGDPAPGDPTLKAAPAEAATKTKKVVYSDTGRVALQKAKESVSALRGLRGGERTQALQTAASGYDKVAVDFATEPAVAAAAAFAAAELWRQQGNLQLAEKDFLAAVQLDGERFGQRGLMGAADMQRRQKRYEEALVTYQKAAALEPGSARAQDARLWRGRLLQDSERLDEAIPAFQAALESAAPGAQTIDACNFLAIAQVAKGDFDAAVRAIEFAEQSVQSLGDEDPIVIERLKKALEGMTAKKSLQRARDKQVEAGKDAQKLEADQHGR
jgi:tetratricopeptide (TPR) repeat protein